MLSLQILTFICFLLCDLMRTVHAATSVELIALRQQKGVQECIDGWINIMSDSCVYPGQKTPCFKEPAELTKTHDQAAKEFAENCCIRGCHVRDSEKFCCRERHCLNKCYDALRLHRHRNTGSLERRSKLSFSHDN